MKKRLFRRSLVTTSTLGVAVAVSLSIAVGATANTSPGLGENLVGRQTDGSVLVPEGKFVKPVGDTIEQTGQVMDLAIRPDGQTAVDLTKSGKGLFTVVDLESKTVLQQYSPPKGIGSNNVSVGGLLYSADGTQLWAAQAKNILRFDVAADGTLSNPVVVAMPETAPGGVPKGPDGTPAQPLPSGLTWAPDHKTIITSLSGYDTVAGIDSSTGQTTWQTAVGVAPRDVVVVGQRLFVSNEGGRRTKSSDFANYSYNTPVVADDRDGRADSGTVSEIDLSTHAVARTYDVGLDPSALMAHGTDVLVTNSSDDTVSVLDTTKGEVSRTFNVNPIPGQPYGSSPNALAMIDNSHLAVSLGRNNALAIYEWSGAHSTPTFSGLVPTAWYPGKIIVDQQLGKLVVGNLKGVGALGDERTIAQGPGTNPAKGKQVYADVGVVQILDAPKPAEMAALTTQVFTNNQWTDLNRRNPRAAGRKAAAVPVPKRVGDPSPIKHVYLIVRENRTYDQVLGDDPRGNGDPSMTQFGKGVTPNTHALAKEFPLIDNLYSDGTNSATGHTWLDAGFVNDYLERSYANYVRNYGQPDAMVYPKSGFLWDNAQAHNLQARVWGEYAEWFTAANGRAATGSWADWYRDSQILEGKQTGKPHVPLGTFTTKTDIPSLNKILDPDYPNFNTQIPDQYRASLFLEDFDKMDKEGTLPNLNMLWLSSNHTNGATAGYPTPAAMQADSDLAVGRIVDKISHSKDWKSSAIFVIEDDSQNGVDHVDGHRNVPLIISPYAKRGAVIHTNYTQVNVTRTIEQILGLPPMNQVDLAAEPMYDAFTPEANLEPYDQLGNTIPLDTMNPTLAQADTAMERQWITWSEEQDFSKVDQLAFEPFNRLTWYTSNHYSKPYPGDSKVMTPKEVLAKFPQAPLSQDPDGNLPETKALRPHQAGHR